MTKPSQSITATDLSSRVGRVLNDVEAGVTLTITRHGEPVAVLSPVAAGRSRTSVEPYCAEEAGQAYGNQESPLKGLPASALARLVTTPSTRTVMSLFLLDPELSLHQREIARRAGVQLRSAQLALGRLEALGLLSSRRDGNRLYYGAVRTTRFEELRTLLTRELGIAGVLARHLSDVDPHVTWAFVFGSAASGDDTLGSDIDLLVVADATDDQLATPIANAQRELGRDIDVVSYKPAAFAKKRADGNHFIQSVLSQPRFDVIGTADDA